MDRKEALINLQQLLTPSELIEHMKRKGITFDIEVTPEPEEFLNEYNYYRKLTAYKENYNKRTMGKASGTYIGLDFAYLKELSTIDMHLRYLTLLMCLDIEHFLKVALLRTATDNPSEDGCNIVRKFTAKNPFVARKIESRRSSYSLGLINKYEPDYPLWAFVELISFGNLTHLCSFYEETYGVSVGNNILLNSVRDIRNACAHSNCLINNLRPNGNVPHNSVVDRIKEIKSISEKTRDKRLQNKTIYDFVCMLFAYDGIVTSVSAKNNRYAQLRSLINERIPRHKDWFLKNGLIVSSYAFTKKVVDTVVSCPL